MRSNLLKSFRQSVHNKFRKNETKIHELNYLFWECTRRCNLKCIHCGSDCSSDYNIPDMPFEDFQNAILPLIEKYKKDSITVVITGGEPLLRNDLIDCGRSLRENGFRWGIVTNGLMYNNDFHCRALGAGLGAITLSFDGLESTHNWLRGNKNSFNKCVQAMDLICSSDRLTYDIVTCVNSRNIYEMPEIKEFLIGHKVKTWRLFTIAPIGRAINNPELHLSGKQLVYLMEFIQNVRKENRIDAKFSCEAFLGNYEKKVRDSFFFCRAGINIGSILIDGSISACPNIDRSFVQGNIYNDKFSDVWENKFIIMRNKIWTKTGLCLKCSDYNNCEGGAMHLWNENKDGILKCLNQELKINKEC